MGVHILDRKHNYEHERLNRFEIIPVPPRPMLVATPSAYGMWSALHVQAIGEVLAQSRSNLC
jgi:hypothetical protein